MAGGHVSVIAFAQIGGQPARRAVNSSSRPRVVDSRSMHGGSPSMGTTLPSGGHSLSGRRGSGGEHREVTVGLAGSGGVVGGVDVEDADGVQPASAVAQFVAGELRADVGESEASLPGRGPQDVVEVID